MKKNNGVIVTLIVILSVLAIALIGGMVFIIANGGHYKFNFNVFRTEAKLLSTYEEETSLINGLNIDLVSTDVYVESTTEEKIKVEYYTNDDKVKVDYKLDNGTLNIREDSHSTHCVGLCFYNSKLIVYVPETYIGSYNIKLISGDIKSNVYIDSLNIQTTSGDIDLLSVNKLNVQTTSGDIRVDSVTGEYNSKSVSGDVKINHFNIKNNSRIETTSGDIAISDNQANAYFDYKTTSGDARINRSDRKSDIEVYVHTVSGDINVD